MKIDDHLGIRIVNDGLVQSDRKNSALNASDFSKQFKDLQQANIYEQLSDLASKIDKQGTRIGERIDINELRYYKNMISEFLQQALYVACAFEKESSPDRRGKLRVYALINKVNEKVDSLTKEVLKDEKDHLLILQMLYDIRGLVLDLTM